MALHPTHPVTIQISSGLTDAGNLIPVYLHGDGGRHYRKQEIMVMQFQSAVGAGTRLSQGKTASSGSLAQVNLLNHSFQTRFLIATMKKEFYMQDPEPLLNLMEHVSGFFKDLYVNGILHRGQQLRFLLLGVKGDLPFLAKVASMERTFSHIRKRKRTSASKELPGICWLCAAGVSSLPFEDLKPEAAWIATQDLENQDPWSSPPRILKHVLHDPLRKPAFFKLDLFHILNAGLYKDYAASSLSLMLGLFGEGSQDRNLAALNNALARFLKSRKLQLHCRSLTLSLIGADSLQKYPSGGWSKAQDGVVLMDFIPWLLEDLQVDFRCNEPWRFMHAGCSAVGEMMRILYAEGVFLEPLKAQEAGLLGYNFLTSYMLLAQHGVRSGRLVYNLTPKLHYLHHVVEDLCRTGRVEPDIVRPMNPVVHSTAQCEDFIGRIARISRRVKSEKAHERLLRRYKAALAHHFGLLD